MCVTKAFVADIQLVRFAFIDAGQGRLPVDFRIEQGGRQGALREQGLAMPSIGAVPLVE